MKKVAETIKRDLTMRGIGQTELASMLGVSQSYVNMLLTGKKAFGKKQAIKFNNLFGYSQSFLLTGAGNLYDKVTDGESQEVESAQPLNNANIDRQINELLSISANLFEMFKSVNDRLAESTAIITKSQQQFDRVLDLYEQAKTKSDHTSYGMVAEHVSHNERTSYLSRNTQDDDMK